MTSPARRTSARRALTRSSNSPRYLVPATMEERSRASSRLPRRSSGTWPAAMRRASPSATAVLPTPGSPMRAAGQDLDDPAELLLPADHRVQETGGGLPGQIFRELFQQLCISPFCVGLGGLAGPAALRRGAAQDAQKGGAQAAGVRAAGGQNLEGRPLAAQEEPQQQVTGADGGGAQPGPFGGGPLHGAPAPGRQALAGPPSGGAGPSQPGHLLPEVLGAQPGAPEGPPGRPLSLPDQAQQQVLGPHIAVPQPCGDVLGQLQG